MNLIRWALLFKLVRSKNFKMEEIILQTKLHTPIYNKSLVARPHLINQLDTGLAGKCTLISAPAGFGKTSLAVAWLSQKKPTDSNKWTWLSLDESDNDLRRFLIYLIAAFQKVDERVGDTAVALVQSPQLPPGEYILSSLINDMSQINSNFILVLDDYHVINAPTVHDMLTFFVENSPANLHLVIISRSDPPLPLARLRVRGQMIEIRQADLQFTAVEATAFLNEIMGLSLSASHIETLESRTEGWIAGLQLVALSLRGKEDIEVFINAFSGSHRYVIDYLAEEVIQGLPIDWQQFILQTSILNRLNGALSEAVTGQADGQAMLEKLEASNMFIIPLDDERGWFRYHHLFMDVMANRLQQHSPDQIPELHLRAAQWFQKNYLFAEAIDHALAANDAQMAADLVEGQASGLLHAGRVSTLLSWLNKLPPDIVNNRPWLNIFTAWVYLLIGKQDQIEGYLSIAENNIIGSANRDSISGNIAAIRAYAAAQMGNLKKAINQANRALKLLPRDDYANRAVVSFVMGGVYYLQQDIPRALASMYEASQLGERAGNTHVAVQALSSAGGIHLRQGNLAESESAFKRVLRLGRGSSGQPLPITASAHVGLAELHLAQGDLNEARQFAEKAQELGEVWVNVDSQVGSLLVLCQVEIVEDNPNQARAALERAKYLATTRQITPGFEEQFEACEASLLDYPKKAVSPELLDPLSEHELEVLRLISAGLSNRETAVELYLSVNTVKWHLKNIYSKLHVHNRVEAVSRAQELGYI